MNSLRRSENTMANNRNQKGSIMNRRGAFFTAALGAVLVGLASGPASAGQATELQPLAVSHAQITGSGSSWSSNAVNQWIADVTSNGLQVVFTPTGSATGRKDFTNRTTDFAVSDIGYQGADKVTGRAKYGADIRLTGMLYGAMLRSPHAHANIKRIDISKAEKLPGVRAVVIGTDLPEQGDRIVELGEGAVNMRHLGCNVLARHKVNYRGHAVAARPRRD